MNKSLYKPIFISSTEKTKKFLKKHPYINFIDAFERQIKELFLIDNPVFIGRSKVEAFKTSEFVKYKINHANGYTYIFYPWNHHMVKCVKDNNYFRLTTNRNQDLITVGEQKKFYDYRVAIFGMSVGSNIAYVLTQAGISKNIIIADFDDLDTTNLNRIWAGVHQVGLNKTIIAARRIYENNPYADVVVLKKGIDNKLLEKLLKEKRIDCIVDEIDNLQMKIVVRQLAMKYEIPVLMITDNGDRVVLTIERYDLKYKKILEKTVNYWEKRISSSKNRKDFGDIVINDIVGGFNKVDPKMIQSVERVIRRELISWPQLGSAALLGGIAVTLVIKEIIRKKYTELFTRFDIDVLRR